MHSKSTVPTILSLGPRCCESKYLSGCITIRRWGISLIVIIKLLHFIFNATRENIVIQEISLITKDLLPKVAYIRHNVPSKMLQTESTGEWSVL
jgi:hypothetical protein